MQSPFEVISSSPTFFQSQIWSRVPKSDNKALVATIEELKAISFSGKEIEHINAKAVADLQKSELDDIVLARLLRCLNMVFTMSFVSWLLRICQMLLMKTLLELELLGCILIKLELGIRRCRMPYNDEELAELHRDYLKRKGGEFQLESHLQLKNLYLMNLFYKLRSHSDIFIQTI